MNYVVVVLDPVPEDLSAAIDVVAERFRIGHDKARALLARVPGPVTKSVPESQARTVADILEQAGLRVELRAGDAVGPTAAVPLRARDTAAGQPAEDVVTPAADDVVTPAVGGGQAASTAASAAASTAASAARHDEPDGEVPLVAAPQVPTPQVPTPQVPTPQVAAPQEVRRTRPEPGLTTTTPPRDPMKTTLTREPPDLERSGLRRRISSAATLPAILTLLVSLLALTATLLPVLRAQQARRAADTAAAVAATIEGLSAGLPLSAPIIRAELRQVEERTRAQLAPRGVQFMTVVGADGSLLLEWSEAASGPGSLTAAQAATVAAAAGSAADQVAADESLGASLAASFDTLLAMMGFGSEEPVTASSIVRRNGEPVGAVVVGLDRAGLRTQLGRVLLTTLLVGLIPVLFAVLAALSLTRGIRDAIRYLLVATDRISHGDFERPVELVRDDELGQIAGAVERMRVSLRESMERLRRRR